MTAQTTRTRQSPFHPIRYATHPCKVDRPESIVDIHQEEDDPALKVSLDLVQYDLLPHVKYLDVRPLAIGLVDGFVVPLVVPDTVVVVLHGLVRIPSAVVRGGDLDAADVVLDNLLVIAQGFCVEYMGPSGRRSRLGRWEWVYQA